MKNGGMLMLVISQNRSLDNQKIHNYDKTYFRIVKGAIHTVKRCLLGNGQRLTKLRNQGIDVRV